MRMALWVVMVAVLGGCASVDGPMLTQFEPTKDGFKFIAKTDRLIYRADSTSGETQRIAWLEEYLSENKLCQKGYRVTERRQVESAGVAPPTIYYYGVCL